MITENTHSVEAWNKYYFVAVDLKVQIELKRFWKSSCIFIPNTTCNALPRWGKKKADHSDNLGRVL